MKSPPILRILQITTNKIRYISGVRGKKTTTPLCLTDEGSNSRDSSVMRFSSAELTFLLPLNNKRKLPQILRILQIITNKISDTRDIRGKKTTKLAC